MSTYRNCVTLHYSDLPLFTPPEPSPVSSPASNPRYTMSHGSWALPQRYRRGHIEHNACNLACICVECKGERGAREEAWRLFPSPSREGERVCAHRLEAFRSAAGETSGRERVANALRTRAQTRCNECYHRDTKQNKLAGQLAAVCPRQWHNEPAGADIASAHPTTARAPSYCRYAYLAGLLKAEGSGEMAIQTDDVEEGRRED